VTQVLGPQNPRIAELRRLIGRRSSRSAEIVLEGPRAVGEAIDAHLVPATVIVPESEADSSAVGAVSARIGAGVEWLVVRDHVFEKLAPSSTPQPMLALVARPQAVLPTVLPADAVVLTGGADPWGPKAVRASAGSVLRVPIVQLAEIGDAFDALRAAGARIVGTDVRAGEPHDGGVLDGPVAIVMGSEPHGLGGDADVDAWCHIAMPGRTESLNVAMAGTLLLYEARRS